MTAVQTCLSVGADICSPDVGKTYAHRPEQNRHAQTPETEAEQDACARVGRRRLGTLGRSGESRGRQLERIHAPSSVRASSRSARRGEGQQMSALEAASPPGGTCWVPAAALTELVLGYRALIAMSGMFKPAPPEALASGTDNSFGGTTRPEAPSSADPADTATPVKTDSSLVSLSGPAAQQSVECPRCQVRYSPPDADCPGCAELRLRGIRSGH